MALKCLISKTTGKYLKSKNGQLLGKGLTEIKTKHRVWGDNYDGSGSYILTLPNGYNLAVKIICEESDYATFCFSADCDLHTIVNCCHYGYNSFDLYHDTDLEDYYFEFYDWDYYEYADDWYAYKQEHGGEGYAEANYLYDNGRWLFDLQIRDGYWEVYCNDEWYSEW